MSYGVYRRRPLLFRRRRWIGTKVAAGGVTYPITLDASATGVASLSRVVTYSRTLSASAVGVATLTKVTTFLRTLSVSMTPAVTLTKVAIFPRTLSASALGTAALSKVMVYARTLSVSALGTATLTKIMTYARTLSASAVGTATLSKITTYLRTLNASAAGVATLSRVAQYYRTLNASALGVASLTAVRFYVRTLSASASGVATLSKIMIYVRTLTATAQGWTLNHINLDGVDDYASIRNINPSTGAFTLEFWLRNDVFNTNDRIIDQADPGPLNGWTLVQTGTGQNIAFVIYNGAGQTANIQYTPPTPSKSRWLHIIMRHDGVNTATLFVDGVQAGQDTSAAMVSNSRSVDIGRRTGGGNLTEMGFTNFRYYSRAISDVEAAEHYAGTYNDNSNLQAKIDFQDGTGTVAYDTSGNNNHADLSGATWAWPRFRVLLAGRTLNASAIGVATLNRVAQYYRALSATAVGVATLNRGYFRTLSATATGIATLATLKILGLARATILQVTFFQSRVQATIIRPLLSITLPKPLIQSTRENLVKPSMRTPKIIVKLTKPIVKAILKGKG